MGDPRSTLVLVSPWKDGEWQERKKESFRLRHRLTDVLGGWAIAVCIFVGLTLLLLLVGW